MRRFIVQSCLEDVADYYFIHTIIFGELGNALELSLWIVGTELCQDFSWSHLCKSGRRDLHWSMVLSVELVDTLFPLVRALGLCVRSDRVKSRYWSSTIVSRRMIYMTRVGHRSTRENTTS